MFRHESFEPNAQLAKSFDGADQSYRIPGFGTAQAEVLAQVLSRALRDEPRFAHVIPNRETRAAVLPLFFASAIRVSELCGETFVTPSAEGGAIWIRPGGTPGFQHMLRSQLQQLPFKLHPGYLRRALKLGACLERIHQRLAGRPHWYLLSLGVHTCKDRDTMAAALISPVLSRADSEGVSCYVETFLESDLPLYEEHGFRIEGSGRVPGSGPIFWIMMRAPRS
jgi:integrase